MSVQDRRFTLRENTSDRHHALDAQVGDWADRTTYGRYLISIFGFRTALAHQMASGCIDAAPEAPAILSEIRLDMADLELNPRPFPTIPLDLEGDGWLGVRYVMLGSSVGARLLVRRADAIGLTAQFGARHLARMAGGSAPWGDFLTDLANRPNVDMLRAIAAANATFALAQAAFACADRESAV